MSECFLKKPQTTQQTNPLPPPPLNVPPKPNKAQQQKKTRPQNLLSLGGLSLGAKGVLGSGYPDSIKNFLLP